MKKLFPLLAVLFFFSCEKQKTEDRPNPQVQNLYEELRSTYKIYADSLDALQAPFSPDTLILNLDDRVKRIYSKYPVETDQFLSQAQNDTLWSLVSRIVESRRRLNSIPTEDFEDSIVSDSSSFSPDVKEL